MKEKNGIKVGDIIHCIDKEDMVATSTCLAKDDIETDFKYELNGFKGYYLEVIKIE